MKYVIHFNFKQLWLLYLMLPILGFSQKKVNGTIYIEHPAINVVDAFTKAMVAGDTTAMGKLMTNDFKAYNAVNATPSDNGTSKSAFLRNAKVWHEQLDYYSIKTMEGAYPDAFEYTKDLSDNRAVTVQSWDMLKGMHKTTGVKVDMFLHRSFTLTKDNKINRLVSYINPEATSKIGAAMMERKNGTIYNEHKSINNLRLMFGAAENGDMEKAYTYYDEKATFYNINDPDMKALNLDENKAGDKAIFEKYELKRIEQVGYPDYLEYEMSNEGVVFSWWIFYFIRKSDKKEIKVPIHYQHNVNAEGKFTNEIIYFSAALFN